MVRCDQLFQGSKKTQSRDEPLKVLRKKRTDRVSTSKWHQRWPGKALQRKNIVLRKKMRNYRCSLYWFEHLVVSRFIHPSVILSFVSLIYRGLSPVYKWGNLNLLKLKQLKILYQTFWFKHRKNKWSKLITNDLKPYIYTIWNFYTDTI